MFILSFDALASTAAVERLFSVAGRICCPHRTRFNPDAIELLMTLKYRLLSEKRFEIKTDAENS